MSTDDATYRCEICGADVPTYPVGTGFVRLIPHKDDHGKRCVWSNTLREVAQDDHAG